MKDFFKYLLSMVYPMLISLFLFIFTTAFVKGDYLETLQITTIFLVILFGILFLIGIIGKLVILIRQRKQIIE